MKLPLKPPSHKEISNELLKQNRLKEVFKHFPTIQQEEYYHWDKLIHLRPPHGLSNREWWYILKLKRSSSSKQITLKDKENNPFYYTTVDPIPEILHEIGMNAGGRILMEDNNINPEIRDQYIVRSLMEEAITSSQIEGASTTRMVAKELIRSGRKPENLSEQMILNNYITMSKIGEFRKQTLTKELVFRIHELITRDTLADKTAAGRFRRKDEVIEVSENDNIVLHEPPDASELPDRMNKMCDFANGNDGLGFINPVIRSIILHFWLAYDHPFCDGNGRTARALFYWSMLHHEYWLFEFISISEIIRKSKRSYLKAFLYTETDYNDLTYFILYHLDVIEKAIRTIQEFIIRRTQEAKKLEMKLRSILIFNHRQRALINHALKHPRYNYTVKGHQISHKISYQTARTDLLGLVKMGLLENTKYNKTWYFTPVPDLEDKLLNVK